MQPLKAGGGQLIPNSNNNRMASIRNGSARRLASRLSKVSVTQRDRCNLSICIAGRSVIRRKAACDMHNKRNVATSSSPNNVDTLIIGGGPIGLSTAYHLASQYCDNDSSKSNKMNITVIERDPTYARSSATLSAGGIRQQFSLEENIQMSLYGRDFLRNANTLLRVEDDNDEDDEEIDVQFQEHGYLFMAATSKGREQLIQNNKVQQSAGCTDINLMNSTQLKSSFPWLNTDDILLGSFGERGEGWFDPWALIRGLKRKCQDLGVQIVKGLPVGAARDEASGRVLSVDVRLDDYNPILATYNVGTVVNAAGAHCTQLMETLAGKDRPLVYPIPVEPRKRCIFFIHCNTEQEEHIVPQIAPLTVCPLTGVYFRSEGLIREDGTPTGNFLCGVSPTQENDGAIGDMSELDYADYELWDEIIWPALYHRVPAFGEVKVKSSWAGLYECEYVTYNIMT